MSDDPPDALSARDLQALRRTLYDLRDDLQRKMPSKGRDRTKAQKEWFALCRGLFRDLDELPSGSAITIHKQERPDFVLCADDATIGIEVTELIGTRLAHALNVADEQGFDLIHLDEKFFRDAKRPMTREQIATSLQDGGDGFAGDRPERDKARELSSCILGKTRKLEDPDWAICDQHWLYVFDCFGFPISDDTPVIEIVRSTTGFGKFSRIVLVSSRNSTMIHGGP